eukprot:767137-Hanusia_phi.AAC.8
MGISESDACKLLQRCTLQLHLGANHLLLNEGEDCDFLDIILYGAVRVECSGTKADEESDANELLLLPGDAYGCLQTNRALQKPRVVQVFHEPTGPTTFLVGRSQCFEQMSLEYRAGCTIPASLKWFLASLKVFLEPIVLTSSKTSVSF